MYWDKDGIRSIDSLHSHSCADELKLCFDFLRLMNTSLALPLLARYWAAFRLDVVTEAQFVEVVKALTAYIVLRRGVTGTTRGIDSELRRMMREKPGVGGDPLCSGANTDNDLIGVDALKKELRDRYLRAPCEASERDSWVGMAKGVALGQYSRPLCRLLLLAASHNARRDSKYPGLLSRKGVRRSDELDYLNFRTWDGQLYATVEHVAPNSGSNEDWDRRIYEDLETRHAIGNLILLPQRENSSIGNVGWARKKVFYAALVAATEVEKDRAVSKAKKMGFSFGKRTESLLAEGERLRMLDSLVGINEWNKEFIDLRSQRTLELAWDQIWAWVS